MVFLFKDKSIGSVFSLIVLALITHVHLFFTPINIVQNEQTGFFSFWLQQYEPLLNSTFLAIVYIAVLLVQAIRLNLILNELRMYNISGFTTAMSYILLSSFFIEFASLSAAFLANFFIIIIFKQLSKLYNDTKPKTTLFNTGLTVGIAMLCYHPTSMLILVVLFAVALIRPFNITEWLVLLMGVIMPIYLTASFLFLNDKLALITKVLPNISINLPAQKVPISFWIGISLIAFQLIMGFNAWSIQNRRMVIQIRKNWGVMVVMVIMMLPIPFIFTKAGITSAILYIIPLSAFIGNAYAYPRKILLPNILFFASIILVLYNNWLLIKN